MASRVFPALAAALAVVFILGPIVTTLTDTDIQNIAATIPALPDNCCTSASNFNNEGCPCLPGLLATITGNNFSIPVFDAAVRVTALKCGYTAQVGATCPTAAGK
ncbi:hypothetical protein WJX72_002099 [[Myrmecia] bisecta]|uniref:Bifunctional inhibitor/plant lipid transfer protein/seed storage helical domain-containing protein n=1 Tax=[Myrmecia] bisecta TaxID=41462 RepID=A0AAW1QBK2_9CHLO